jgi:hypothetical protein
MGFLTNIRLILYATLNEYIYIFGCLPIHMPYPYNPWDSWNEYLAIQNPSSGSSHIFSHFDLLSRNIAWVFYNIIQPCLGGLFMYIFTVHVIKLLKDKEMILSSIIVGATYGLILISNYTDFWIKGFLAIIPAVLLFSLIAFEEIENNNWRKAYLFASLTAIFLSALYDWRLQLSGVVLIFIFLLGNVSFSSILRLFKEKRFWMLILVSFSVWCITWLAPHLYGTYLYLLSYTRGVTLAVIVGDYSFTSVFGLYTGDNFLRLIYYLLICFAFSSLLLYPKNKFILVASISLICITLITWERSPLKIAHYYLTLLKFNELDIGTLFRTHKFFTGITLPLTISLFGISSHKFMDIVKSRKLKMFVAFLLLLLVGLTAIQVTATNSLSQVTIIPEEYFQISEWLKSNQSLYRTLWLPRTGKYRPGECPVWLKTEGWGAPETSLGLRTYYYYGKPMEYLYPFLMRLLEENKTRSAAYILSYLGVKYVALHNDYWWSVLQNWVAATRRNLDTSPYFKLQAYTEHIFIYEDLLTDKPVHVATMPVLIDGGLRTLASLIESSNADFSNCLFFFTDLQIPKEVIYSAPVIVTDSINDLRFNLLTNLLISDEREEYILVPSYFTKGIEKGEWHPLFVDNPHHAEWEVFYTWNYLNIGFENSFKFSWGFVGSQAKDEILEIPLNFERRGNYTILIRYFENEKGGEVEVEVEGEHILIQTKGYENRFKWFIANLTVKDSRGTITIRNISGRNALNVILALPSEEFNTFLREVEEILTGKKIILPEDLKEYYAFRFNASNNSDIIIQSIEYKDDAYVLKILTKIENVSIGVTIPEQYHGGWIAYVDGGWKVSSTPHLFVNNFWITLQSKGSHEIRIEFTPQKTWRIIYVVNACITISILILSPLCLIYDKWKEKKRYE